MRRNLRAQKDVLAAYDDAATSSLDYGGGLKASLCRPLTAEVAERSISELVAQGWVFLECYDLLFLDNLTCFSPSESGIKTQYFVAAQRDVTKLFFSLLSRRLVEDANFYIEIDGIAGSGKSTCALSIFADMGLISAAQLAAHVAYTADDFTEKIGKLPPRSGMLLDEVISRHGIGAKSATDRMKDVENQVRALQKCGIHCSPNAPLPETVQDHTIILSSLAVNRDAKKTLFMMSIGDKFVGLVAIDWVGVRHPEIWEAYKPLKQDNLNQVDAQERDVFKKYNKMAWAVFSDAEYQARLAARVDTGLVVEKYAANSGIAVGESMYVKKILKDMELLSSKPALFRSVYGRDAPKASVSLSAPVAATSVEAMIDG